MQHIMTILYFITYLYKFEQISNINRRMNIEQSMIFDVDEVIDITTAPITSVLSFTTSITKKYSIIGTQRGFCLIDNSKKSFRRFQADKNPFKAEENTGVQLGTALEQRTEVAVIPTRKSQKFNKNTVYIFDYQLNTILYSNDFFLPIRQMTLIDDTIIVSNNKRIVIYNYSNDTEIKTQEFYLKMYQSRVPNNHIRYLEMSCEEKISNNSIEEFEGNQNGHLYKECLCGKYSISGVKPYKLLYSKVFTVNGSKNIQLSLYDWAFDKDYVLQSLNYNEPFSFTISEDGNFIAYSTNEGRNICVMKLGQKKVFCNLSISSSIKNCISCGFFSYDDALWFTSIRNGDNSNGHMHFFKIQKKKQEGQIIKPRYSRYFSLFQRTMADYGICSKLIGPQFYVINGAVNSSSVCGAVVEIIDLKISGNHIKKTVQNLLKWKEEIY